MKLPFISKESHELIVKAVELEYENKIAKLQRPSISLWDVLSEHEDDGHVLYKKAKEPAKSIKIFIQMSIGIGLFASLIFRLIIFFFQVDACRLPANLSGLFPVVDFLSKRNVLEIVGEGLALSASIELIYMLFTDGLDEAVDPLIIGTASGILILLSRGNVSENSVSILVLAIVLAVLFTVQRIFFRKKAEDGKPSAPQPE